MDLDRAVVLAAFVLSTLPFAWMAIRENGSSRGWLSRLFVGQDFLLLISAMALAPLLGEGGEHTLRLVFGMSLVFKFLKGVELIVRRSEFARADPFYNKEIDEVNRS